MYMSAVFSVKYAVNIPSRYLKNNTVNIILGSNAVQYNIIIWYTVGK